MAAGHTSLHTDKNRKWAIITYLLLLFYFILSCVLFKEIKFGLRDIPNTRILDDFCRFNIHVEEREAWRENVEFRLDFFGTHCPIKNNDFLISCALRAIDARPAGKCNARRKAR